LTDDQKYLIIGAGPVGLAHIKALKMAEIPFEAVDAEDDLGGNWHHGVYETAHIISPKGLMEYSDYAMPKNYPEFPSGKQVLAYYNDYANHFGLREFITFNKKVEFVYPTEDNKWQVKFSDGEIKLYKGVLVCNGHHWDKRYPIIEGAKSFKGEILHSKDYKTPDQLKGKNVVVVGAGNSACDVASEAARVGASSYMSIRSSAWFLPKLVAGYPLSHFAKNWLPPFIQRTMLKIGLRLTVGDLSRYGLPKPDHDILTKHPTIGTEALHYIKHGKLTPKPGISRITEDEVEFIDGTKVKADLIVTATGFHLSYPFLPKELHRTKGAFAQVYGRSMLADFKGIYLIGWEQVRGGVGACVPIGAEVLVALFKMQEQLNVPIGSVLKEAGYVIPKSHLIGMFDLLKQLKKLKKNIPKLLKLGKQMDKKYYDFKNQVIPFPNL